MSRWLAVREEWEDVKYGAGARTGGYCVGHFIVRTALCWIDAPTKTAALERAPLGATTVLSFLSLDVDDRIGWLKMPLGVPVVERVPLFEGGTARRFFDRAQPTVSAQLDFSSW